MEHTMLNWGSSLYSLHTPFLLAMSIILNTTLKKCLEVYSSLSSWWRVKRHTMQRKKSFFYTSNHKGSGTNKEKNEFCSISILPSYCYIWGCNSRFLDIFLKTCIGSSGKSSDFFRIQSCYSRCLEISQHMLRIFK